ncbi:MAG: hypothetical protein GY760_22175 [Deltaproteobacteria bacterium]|nr:hypothetical protein [Deltaproteobacteria bacterium]
MYIEIKPDFTATVCELLKWIKFFGGNYNHWYVGLTNDSKHSFLDIHKLDLLEEAWILSKKNSSPQLYFAKKLLTEMGCQNIPELDMNEPDQIYLYQIRENKAEKYL